MKNETKKINAVYIESGYCMGSGCDRFKRVSGITKKQLSQVTELEKQLGALTILVDSNTKFQGQRYKRLEINGHFGQYRDHRQINDADYDIVVVI